MRRPGSAAPGDERPLRAAFLQTAVYGASYVTTALASFILVPFYTRRLSIEEFGVLGLMLGLYGLLSQLYDLGMTNSIGRFYFDAQEDTALDLGRMAATSLLFLTALGTLLTVMLFSVAAPLSAALTGTSANADLIRIVAVQLLVEGIAIVPLTLIRMEQRAGLFGTLAVVRFAATITLNLLLVLRYGQGVRGIMLANAITSTGLLVVAILILGRRLLGRPTTQLLRRMVAFGLPFFPVLVAGWVIDAADRYLVGRFNGTGDVGLYLLAIRISQVMQIGVSAFSMGWAPIRFRILSREDAPHLYRRISTAYVIAAASLGLAVAVSARETVRVIAPPDYATAANVVPLLVAAYIFSGLQLVALTGMGVSKRTGPVAWIAIVGAVVNIGLNLVMIPTWGIMAAGATTVLAFVVMYALTMRFSQRAYPIPYDRRRDLGILAVGGVVVILRWTIPATSLAIGALVDACAIGVYAVAVVALGLVPRDLRRYFSATGRFGWRPSRNPATETPVG